MYTTDGTVQSFTSFALAKQWNVSVFQVDFQTIFQWVGVIFSECENKHDKQGRKSEENWIFSKS